ncbi:MAG: hypothetical protein A2148_01450 [Chloroflexi bacterium RBG_16_68_14]|nr:MAG: hypothetical protein A2148_01450 [Chloroflexi bacterium RBG_16_68_14]
MEPLIALSPLAGLVAVLSGWLYVGSRPRRARLGPDGVQETTVIVRERYRPSTVVARLGIPLRLTFVRDEDDPCSQRVIFPDFGVSRALPGHRATVIDLLPDRVGEFLFTCELGMYQGTLVVVQGRRWWGSLLGTGRR